MLRPASELSEDTRIKMLFAQWAALDTESGAFLRRSSGRPKAGYPLKWFLIVPKEPVAERGLFGPYTWESSGRCVIRAYTLEDAIVKANMRLRRLEKRNAVA